MYRFLKASLLVLAAIATAGCARTGSSTASAVSSGSAASSGTAPGLSVFSGNANGISYEVHGYGSSTGAATSQGVEATAGSNRLQIKDGKLTVNGKGYGTVKSGDSVRVDEKGQVTVNGQSRSPQ